MSAALVVLAMVAMVNVGVVLGFPRERGPVCLAIGLAAALTIGDAALGHVALAAIWAFTVVGWSFVLYARSRAGAS